MPPKTKLDAKKAEADRLQGLVLALLKEEENKYCADCDGKQPRWASWNLGVFICIRCAGIHRNLGVHVSKVKSVNLDSWTAEQCQSMRVMGNAKAKAVYEADLPEHFRRPQTDQQLESFIRAKYEHKRYMMRDWVAPRVDINDIPLAGEENRCVGPTVGAVLKPPSATRVNERPAEQARGHELLDISFASAPVAMAQLHTTPSLLDFDFTASPNVVLPPAKNDDIFGSFVSAGSTAVANSSAPSDPAPSEAAGQLSQITGELSSLSISTRTIDDKKSNSDILALFGNLPKAAPVSQVPQHNWGGGIFGGPLSTLQQKQQQHHPQVQHHSQMNSSGLNSFGLPSSQQSVQMKPSEGMGDLSGLMISGNGLGTSSPIQQIQHQQIHQTIPQSNAFDSLSLNSLFPGGLSQAAFANPQTAAAFAAASPFASPPTMMGDGNILNLDSLL